MSGTNQTASLQVNVGGNATATLQGVQQALNQTGAAATAFSTTISNAAQSGAKLSNQFDAMQKAGNSVNSTIKAVANAQAALALAMNQGSGNIDRFSSSLNSNVARAVDAIAKYDALAQVYTSAGAAAQRSAAQIAAGGTAATNAAVNVKSLAQNTAALATALGTTPNSVNAVVNSMTGLNVGAKNVTQSAGQTKFAVQQLGVQFSQTISGIASGQPVFTTLIQQGHQVIDVMASTGTGFSAFGEIAKAVGGFLIGPGGIAVGIAAVVVGMGVLALQSNAAQEQLITLSQTMRATRTDYDQAAASAIAAGKAFAQANPSVSVGAATTAASTIASTPGFINTPSNLNELLSESQNLAKVMGTDLPAAAKELQSALEDPGAEADKLAKSNFPGFTTSLVDTVKQMEAAHDSAGALKLVLDTIESSTDGASQQMTPLDEALDKLDAAFRSATTSSSGFWATLRNVSYNAATGAITFLAGVISGGSPTGNSASHGASAANFATNGGGGGTGGTGGGSSLQSEMQTLIQALSMRTGVGGNTLSALQFAEGGAGANGSYANVPGGGQGAFGVTKSTFYGTKGYAGTGIVNQPGNYPLTAQAIANNNGVADLNNPIINATAGSEYFSNLLKQYNGDVWDATLAYHYGPSVADAFIKGANPPDIAKDGSAGIREADTVSAAAGQQQGPGRLPSSIGSSSNTGLVDYSVAGNNQDQSIADGISSIEKQRADLVQQIAAVSDALKAAPVGSASAKQDQAAYDALNATLAKTQTTTEAYYTAQAKAITDSKQQGAAAIALQAALDGVNEAQKGVNGGQASAQQQATALANAQTVLNAQFDQTVEKSAIATKNQNDLSAAYLASNGNVQHFVDAQKAAQDALATSDPKRNPELYAQQVAELTKQYDAAAAAAAKFAADQQIQGQDDTLAQLKEEGDTIGENADKRATDLDLIKQTQALLKQGGQDLLDSDEGQQILANTKLIDDQTQSLQHQQDALNEVGDLATQAFSSLGDAITNALVGGSSAGVDFESVLKGIVVQIVEAIAKMAILTPLLNSITGSTGGTLGDLFGGLVSGGGSSSGGSVAGTAASALGGAAASYANGGGISGLLSGGLGKLYSLGSSAYSLGSGIYSGVTGGSFSTGIPIVDSIAAYNTGIGGAVGVSASDAGAAAADGVGGTAGTVAGAGGLSLGTLAGGAGAGFALGTLLNDYVFKGNQTNGTIGAGVGATAGAVAGAILAAPTVVGAPLGALLGGLIGGALGGGGGGLIGPKLPNYGYEVTEQAQSNGLLGISKSGGEGDPGGQAAQALAKQVSQYNDDFNQILAQSGIQASGSTILGGNNYSSNGKGDPKGAPETTDLNSIFQNLSFSSSNPILNNALTSAATKPTDITQLAAISDAWADLSKTMGTLLNPISGANDALGTYGTALANLNANYAQGIKDAQTLGINTKSLTDAQAVAVQALKDQATAQVNNNLMAFQQRDLTATGQGGAAAVQQQQEAAAQETAQFSQQLLALYGTNFKNTAEYASDMAQLAKTQADEAQAQKNADANQYASNTVGFSERTASATGNPTSESDALTAFDIQGAQQMAALQSTLSGYLQEGSISTQQYYAQITQLDQTLASERLAIDKQYVDAAQQELQTLQQQDQSYQARQDAASGNQEGADLINQAISGQQELSALQSQITSYYGTGAQAQSIYASQSAQLEQTLAAEKLAIQQKYANATYQTEQEQQAAAEAAEAQEEAIERQEMDAAIQGVNQIFASISSYAKSLISGPLSPLSPDAQYTALGNTFASEAQGAAKGNIQDLNDLTTAASNFLQASKNVNGSGGQYVADYNAVINALQAVANSTTASRANTSEANATQYSAQQQQLAALQDLNAQLVKLRSEIAQGNANPNS